MSESPNSSKAIDYLRTIKTRFASRRDVYDQFLEIMREFKSSKLITTELIQKIKQLFAGHRDLVLGFNTFLPQEHKISEDFDKEERAQAEIERARVYVNKVQVRFEEKNRQYAFQYFLDIINAYRKGQKTIQKVYEEMWNLFYADQDLLNEFRTFMPEHMYTSLNQYRNNPPQQVRRDI